MSLGVAFALSAEQAAELLALDDDESRDEWLRDLEEEVDEAGWFQYDKDWDELHRCLGDGQLLIQDGPPRAYAVFGSQPLMEDMTLPYSLDICRRPRYRPLLRAFARSRRAGCASASTRSAARTTTAHLWTMRDSNMSGTA
jgi:hypothetical protein